MGIFIIANVFVLGLKIVNSVLCVDLTFRKILKKSRNRKKIMNVVRNKINRVNKVYNKIMMLYNKNKKYKDSK